MKLLPSILLGCFLISVVVGVTNCSSSAGKESLLAAQGAKCFGIDNESECIVPNENGDLPCLWVEDNGKERCGPSECSAIDNEADCAAWACDWTDGACVNPPTCKDQSSEEECSQEGYIGDFCFWTGDECERVISLCVTGESQSEHCSAICASKDEDVCAALGFCTWADDACSLAETEG